MTAGPTLVRERALWAAGRRWVAGLDEVGRGPLAGPVVAAVVILPQDAPAIEGLNDSKVMTATVRDTVAVSIQAIAVAWAVGAASVHEIDRLNIRRATALAMRRALARLRMTPDYVLVDGQDVPELGTAHESMVDGDARSGTIAAASVLAKVVRDRLMARLARRYPAYGWAANKGYGTPEHLAAIHREGPCAHHRTTFEPVSQIPLFTS
ncbi:MAG: ribonuclease HII [Gemmatimonadales bacterium]